MSETPMDPRLVAIEDGIAGYPEHPPFHPHVAPPEYPFPSTATAGGPNPAYDGVRRALHRLGLDRERFGTPEWNPLGDLVEPGMLVVVKPNLVRHWNSAEDHLTALVTHASVIRAVVDLLLVALKGRGEVIVGDAPVQETDFDELCARTGLAAMMEWVGNEAKGTEVRLLDWRKERAHCIPGGGVLRHEELPGDPRGFVEVDLGTRSFLKPLAADHERFRVTNYDCGAMARVHNAEHNCYLVSRSVLQADCIINLAKMKPHGKAGITCALKNNVGINGHKDWLPHHRMGPAETGGDEYEHRSRRKEFIGWLTNRADSSKSALTKRLCYYAAQAVRRTARLSAFKDTYVEGSWHGNDTVWRMVLDLNRVVFFCDGEGVLRPERQRRWLGLVDGIVGGEGDGPLRVTSHRSGILVAGFNPVPIDVTCARLMGLDPMKIPLLRHAFSQDAPVLFEGDASSILLEASERWRDLPSLPHEKTLAYRPPSGWAGRVELPRSPEAAAAR
jgi:uncharacterized protein (DUF362 family)